MAKINWTEGEMLIKNKQHIFTIENKIKSNELTINDIDNCLPGYLHINSAENLSMKYVSPGGCKKFERTNEELVNNFLELSDIYSDMEFVFKTSFNSIKLFSKLKDYQSTFSFLERLRFNPEKDFELFCTEVKLLEGNKEFICITNPISKLKDTTIQLYRLLEENEFFENNFQKFMSLSKREKEILQLLSLGDQNKDICEKLFISKNTIKTHRKHINKKLETNRIADLIKYAIVFRLI